MILGKKAALSYLQDKDLISKFSDNQIQHIYVAGTLALQTGIVYATFWHLDSYKELQSGLAEKIIEARNHSYVEDLLEEKLEMAPKQFAAFCQELFMIWYKLYEAHSRRGGGTAHIYSGVEAAYQLGVSMILEKFGY